MGFFFSSCLYSPLKARLGRGRLSKTIQGKASSIRGKICRKTHGMKGGTVLISGPSTTEFPMQRQNWAGRGRHRIAMGWHGTLLPCCFLQGQNCIFSVRVVKVCLLSYLFDVVSQFILSVPV